jgi:hypothetical protein
MIKCQQIMVFVLNIQSYFDLQCIWENVILVWEI